MYKFNDLSGMKFGRLTVRNVSGRTSDRHLLWDCLCDCGKTVFVSSRDLTSGHTQSCGCLQREKITKHGGRSARNTERLYFVWRGMISRCETPSASGYEYYGLRGVKVCDEWHDYEVFKDRALNNGYNQSLPKYKCTLDRIDCNGDYEPSNCRWVDMHIQNLNKRKMDGGVNDGV